jgi:hypothetical protein
LILHRRDSPILNKKYLMMIHRQMRTKKGQALNICLGGSWLIGPSTSSSRTTLSSSSDQ